MRFAEEIEAVSLSLNMMRKIFLTPQNNKTNNHTSELDKKSLIYIYINPYKCQHKTKKETKTFFNNGDGNRHINIDRYYILLVKSERD